MKKNAALCACTSSPRVASVSVKIGGSCDACESAEIASASTKSAGRTPSASAAESDAGRLSASDEMIFLRNL